MEDNSIISQQDKKNLNSSVYIGNVNPNTKYMLTEVEKGQAPYTFHIGNGKMNRWLNNNEKRYQCMDVLEIMADMTPQEWTLIKLIKDKMLQVDDHYKYITTCKVKIDIDTLSKQDANKISIGYKRLRAKDIVRRVKRGGYYMVNPNFIVPTNYKQEVEEYEKLK